MGEAATRPPKLPPPWFVHTAWRSSRAMPVIGLEPPRVARRLSPHAGWRDAVWIKGFWLIGGAVCVRGGG